MESLRNKIDFAVVFSVKRANPNGDPLNGNRPRIDYDGYGEVSDVCIKRKIRNRLKDLGCKIFVQSDDNRADGDDYRSLKSRAEGVLGKMKNEKEYREKACKEWIDVRTFGQLFAFEGDSESGSGVSIGIRGPVSIHSAFSISPVNDKVESLQIVKSVNNKDTKDNKKDSATMGIKHRVDHGVYVFYGSMNTQLATKTGFADGDAEMIKKAMQSLFQNDESSARPAGSMEVLKVIWWKHNCPHGQHSSAKVHRSLSVKEENEVLKVEVDKNAIPGLVSEELAGCIF